ncbi:MAG: carbonic anhydrase [Planctomycetes bacterium]|nr:carbonic anhydrase [Planctomycetota bacterium]
MDKIVEGIRRFRRDIYPGLKPRYDELVKTGQKPHALVIGCSDSRVAFESLTGCGPGELFIVRNAGNIIPQYGKYMGGVTASIEFAVTALPIRDVIVCGHTHCGAMSALLKPEMSTDMPAVQKWVSFARQAKRRIGKEHTHVFDAHLREAIAENVKLQVEHLRTYPCIEKKLKSGEIRLHGWVYELENGDVVEHDETNNRWLSLTEPEEPKRDVSGRFRGTE